MPTADLTNAPSRCDWTLFTDLDGTFLGHSDFSVGSNLVRLNQLEHVGVRCVINTSKTASEVRTLWQQWGVEVPAIVENGGGLLSGSEQALPGALSVDEISQRLPDGLTPLARLPAEQVQAVLGLSESEVEQALDRRYSLPVLPFDDPALQRALAHAGLHAPMGGRIANVAAIGQSKATAVGQVTGGSVAAIGDAPNDLEMLMDADWSALVRNPSTVAQMCRHFSPDFVSTKPAPEGWSECVAAFINFLKKDHP